MSSKVQTRGVDIQEGGETTMRITPFLWFNDQAEEAMRFYASIFPDSEVLDVMRDAGAVGERGRVLGVTFRLLGQEVMALNGGPNFKLNEAFSFFVSCDTQEEVDDLWTKLTAGGGEPSMCGWLKDKFGVSWQIIPRTLTRLMADPDAEKAGRVTQAMLKMRKIDIAALERAYAER